VEDFQFDLLTKLL